MQRMSEDETLRSRLLAMDDGEALMAAIKAEGYAFTQDQIAMTRLSDDDLEDVAGGFAWSKPKVPPSVARDMQQVIKNLFGL